MHSLAPPAMVQPSFSPPTASSRRAVLKPAGTRANTSSQNAAGSSGGGSGGRPCHFASLQKPAPAHVAAQLYRSGKTPGVRIGYCTQAPSQRVPRNTQPVSAPQGPTPPPSQTAQPASEAGALPPAEPPEPPVEPPPV